MAKHLDKKLAECSSEAELAALKVEARDLKDVINNHTDPLYASYFNIPRGDINVLSMPLMESIGTINVATFKKLAQNRITKVAA